MNIQKILIGVCSLMFLMIGADKFLHYLEPPCSMEGNIPPMVWMGLGVLQLVAGILIWLPKYTKLIAGFFTIFMGVFILVHLSQDTKDIGGAAFMAVLLGVLYWNPSFIRGKGSVAS